LNTEILQGSVATRLRCCKIFNDSFNIQPLLSLTVKELRKSVNICQSYGQEQCPFL